MNRRWVIALAILVTFCVAGPLVGVLTDHTKPEQKVAPLDSASTMVAHFFGSFLANDGAIVRPEHGNDTTLDGEATGLLLAAATRDVQRFEAMWAWTNSHLRRADGTYAARWADGAQGAEPAAAGTRIDLARALALAGQTMQRTVYLDAATQVARGVLADAVTLDAAAKPAFVVAGTDGGRVDLTAFAPRAATLFDALAGGTTWRGVAGEQARILDSLLGAAKRPTLISAWAKVDAQGAEPVSRDGGRGVFDASAADVVVRLAESCDAADRGRASRMWTVLSRSPDSRRATSQSLTGRAIDATPSAAAMVGAAAGAVASGQRDVTYDLLHAAEALSTKSQKFEDARAVALGRVMLTTDWLGGC